MYYLYLLQDLKNLKYDSNKDFDALHKSIPLWFKDGFSEINRLK